MLSKLRLSWTGDFASLKIFVGENLNLQGTWSSPGGERKVFVAENLTIQWLQKKKFLSFEGKNVNKVVNHFIKYMCTDSKTGKYDACNIDNAKFQNKQKAKNDENPDGETSMERQSSSVCICSDLSSEITDLKLDFGSLKSKLYKRIHIIEDKISSSDVHINEDFNIYGNLTTNAPKTPMLVVRDGEKLAGKLSEYDNDQLNDSNDCPALNDEDSNLSVAIVYEQNTAISNLNTEMRNSTSQCIHEQHTEALGTTLQDQPSMLNQISSPLVNAQTSRYDRTLSHTRCKKRAEQNGISNADHETGNPPNKTCKSSKDCATNTLSGDKPPNNFKRSTAKHLTPCPFMKGRGFCLKGSSCDFLHGKFRPSNVTQRPPKNLMNRVPLPYSFPPFPMDRHYFPPFHPPTYHPTSRQSLYMPSLMSLRTTPLVLNQVRTPIQHLS